MTLKPELMNDIRGKLDELAAPNEFLRIASDMQAQQTIVEKTEQELRRVRGYVVEIQNAMKTLQVVAEDKIVELKIALDRKTADAQKMETHLRHAVQQNEILRKENAELIKLLAEFSI